MGGTSYTFRCTYQRPKIFGANHHDASSGSAGHSVVPTDCGSTGAAAVGVGGWSICLLYDLKPEVSMTWCD
jgi:hypothetical protein